MPVRVDPCSPAANVRTQARVEKDHYVRIIDESGEDYLYPANYFCMVELPQTVERALRKTLPLAV